MATEIDPVVGNWYRNQESDRTFEVVAIDEDEGTVAIQVLIYSVFVIGYLNARTNPSNKLHLPGITNTYIKL